MHLSHSTSPAQSLFRIFVLPTLQGNPPRFSLRNKGQSASSRLQRHPPRRTFFPTRASFTKTRAPEIRSQKWDDEITARIITLVDPETNRLSEPRTRYDILNTLDRRTHRLVQVSATDPLDPYAIPVCKIISKKDAFDAEKKRRQQQKEAKAVSAKGSSVKTLEINWAIDGNDLGHRLERVKEFLEEGRKVEIVLASKKQGRKASAEECEGLLRRIAEVVEGVKGAREARKMQGKLGGFATVVLQGRAVQGREK